MIAHDARSVPISAAINNRGQRDFNLTQQVTSVAIITFEGRRVRSGAGAHGLKQVLC